MAEAFVVSMPKLGETVTEGTVNAWLKQVGDAVAFDDPLFEVSTDKVDSEIPSPYDGVLLEILVREGETVPIGTPLVRIGEPGAAAASPAPAPAAPLTQVTQQTGSAAGEDEGIVTAIPPTEAAESGSAGEVFEVTMPKLGETVTEGTVNSWLKRVGDDVAFDDPLFEVSTDKVDSEIPSPYDGTLLEILVREGETVPVGTPLVRIGSPGAASAPPAGSANGGAGSAGSVPAPSASAAPVTPAPISATPPANPGAVLSPVVRRLIAEHRLDLAALRGSGPGGRIRREDVESAIAGTNGASAGSVPATRPSEVSAVSAAPAAPAPATTPAPVITPASTPAPAPAAAPASSRPVAAAATSSDPRDEVVTLSRMRLLTADLMVKSLNTSAHVWTSVEVDFEAIEIMRRRFKEQFKKDTGASLSYLPFIARATCDALRAFPAINSSIDVPAKTMTMHPYVNLGIAVDLDEQGLVVPVVKDADALNIRGVASRIASLAAAARAKKLGMPDMSGSTFTITNPGPFSSYASSPVINQPNVAILCTDGVKRRPVAVGDAIAVHATGIIGLVYDHRAFDGSTASKFLLHLRNSLQDRDWEAELI